MLLEDIAQVNAQYLQQLCDDKCPESETLDFKRDLPGNSDKDKHELLKDICALANAGGGDLVYCVDEIDGVAASIVQRLRSLPTTQSDEFHRYWTRG